LLIDNKINNNNSKTTATIVEAQTYDERLESMYEYQDKNHKWPNVIAVLNSPEGPYHRLKQWILGNNVITNDGEIFYAQKAVGETPAADEDFGGTAGRLEFRTGSVTPAVTDTYNEVTTPVTASRKGFDTANGYPKRNDGNTENTGRGINIVSSKTAYVGADFNASGIIGGCIHGDTTPAAATKLLCHFSIASFAKDADSSMNFYVNHLMGA
jgi:hypothetical protein